MIKQIRKSIEKRRSFISLTSACSLMRVDRYTPGRSMVNMLVGGVCVLYGVVTLCLPTGSIPMILFGSMLVFSPFSLSLVVKQVYNDVKFKLWSLWERF